ncbi:MAG: arylsulfatase family protein, partial [Verrucomicrobia bacterium]|nr:arylsulfatase family protein [Verrucomicrobiota bacterium]
MLMPNMQTRRNALKNIACGFGYLALAGMTNKAAAAVTQNPLAAKTPHFKPKAKRVIFIFMQGGPSHVDTFDYKPILTQRDGEMRDFMDSRKIANSGNKVASSQRIQKPLWDFKQYGQCGRWASDLFPETAKHSDDLCFIKSMQTEGIAHGPATLFLHTGATNFIRPSMGSWITYGLGTENDNMPGFVTISPSSGNGGPRNFGTAFLPPVYQGTALGKAGAPAAEATIRNLRNSGMDMASQRRQFDLLQSLNAEQLKQHPGNSELEAVINSYELAWRMQGAAPSVIDTANESPATLALYGIGEKDTDNFGRQCLLARRMAESGVRYIQVTYGDNT